jgi:predicted ferric reductase
MLDVMQNSDTHSFLQSLRRDEKFIAHPRQLAVRAVTGDMSTKHMPRDTNSSVLPYTQGLEGVDVELDHYLLNWLWISIVIVALVLLGSRLYQLFNAHLRHIYSMAADSRQQNYWCIDKSSLWPAFKKQFLYAPFWKKRHNREIRLSQAVNVGTLPSRFHALILFLYVASNIAYCCILDYRNSSKAALIAEVRGRTGVLATANMIPLVLLASRNNPAIALLKVSFDTFNLLHRWMGRIVVAEALAHTIAWGANSVQAKGMHETFASLTGDTFLQFGLTGVIAMVVIFLQSPSAVRHAFYETFLHLHPALAFLAIVGVYIHLEVAKLPALPYIRAVVGIWAGERITRGLRLFYLNLSRRHGCTAVLVEALPGEACRVTFQLPRHITVRPGSHVYAYLPRISWWMSHPFSVAWTNTESEPPTGLQEIGLDSLSSPDSLEKQSRHSPSVNLKKSPTSISLIMAARTGMTLTLYRRAMSSPSHTINLSGYIEGPYAGHDSLSSYGTAILFAGGAGITHHLVQIRHLIASSSARTVATRKIILVWSVRNVEMLAWVRPWMDEILHMPGRREVLKMELYVTKPRNGKDLVSPSNTVRLHQGRCRPGAVLDDELPSRVGATAVSVCGPGAFADDVRAAVRERMHWGSLDFFEEAFTW